MLLIACPWCGPRSLAEFAFDRPIEAIVTLEMPPEDAMGASTPETIRADPRGNSGGTPTAAAPG